MSRPSRMVFVLIVLLLVSASGVAAAPASPPASPWQDKVDPWVLQTGAHGPTEFLVFLSDQADLRPAAGLPTKTDKGEFVYHTLSQQAERTQGPLRRRLAELGVAYRPFWVANMIWVRGGLDVVQVVAERDDVAHVYANPSVKLDVVQPDAVAEAAGPAQPDAVEWNITKVNAPSVWAAGFGGAGAVIAGQDTGYRWTHNALKSKYRGWNGSTATHDYNWHDAIHPPTGSSCGANAQAPCDDQGHGTHTMGTMVGDDGAGNQVGMAPGAKWISCRNMDQGAGTPATYSECYQWFIAPTNLSNQNPDPSKAPDVINNSWGCPPSEGCTDPNALLTVVQNVVAAGIVTVHSAGNSGSACSTVSDPAAIYDESFTVGATTNTATDDIASYSSRGPVTIDSSGRMKPDISAPGSGVRSSYYSSNNAYTTMSGTSMAGPHVAGLVALLISSNPALKGHVSDIRTIIGQSALHKTTTQGCGGDGPNAVPNNVYGWGRIDAYAAICAPVTDLSIARLNATDIKLTWGAKTGVTTYDVWWNPAPYFAPGVTCTAGACTPVATTSFTQSVLGDPNINYSYLVLTKSACGVLPSLPPKRVGEFEFTLTKGLP